MDNVINVIKNPPNSEILIVTPTLPGHKISHETKTTIKRNKIPFSWIVSEGNNNIPTNALNGINWYVKKFGKPKYYLMIDRDIILCRNMIDKMYRVLKDTKDNIGFTYANFKYKGFINAEFPVERYNIDKLIKSNYISSNSMFKFKVIEKVGLVTDNKYKRLLDWAFLLKCYKYGYIGTPCFDASFIALSNKGDVSAGSNEDYRIKYERVYKDFIEPLMELDYE